MKIELTEDVGSKKKGQQVELETWVAMRMINLGRGKVVKVSNKSAKPEQKK